MDTNRFTQCPSLLPDYPELIHRRSIQRILDVLMISAEGRVWQLRLPILNRVINSIVGLPLVHMIPWLWQTETKALEQYSEIFIAFYKTIMELHDTEMFIDSSKRLGKDFSTAFG